ncbi:SURF1 family protein [Sphingomonas sp. PR090111-T3T-6A]|uniref:SURF1 family protein n=1 Tax=Sphingomonas sp. PR090111-T3T-6A TaxID=685778 RepID=UPI000367BF99|nr:SURF1 family protein [Sphingomonas sp. PR090111-T3T-6A]
MSGRLRLPVLPTLLVVLAVAAMVALGFWQIRRLHWKEVLLAEYAAAAGKPPVAFPRIPTDQTLLFRHSEAFCLQPVGWRASAGRNRAGEPGWRHVADCRTGAEGPGIAMDMGWSKDSGAPVAWKGGQVRGVIGPDHDGQVLLVSDEPAPGLQPSAPPSLDDIPNNHFAYAVQWFLFAGVAVVIYGIALRRRRPPAAS